MVFTVLGRATGSRSPADRSQLQSRTPRIYQVTPEILEPATSDTTSESQTTTGRQKVNESARHQLEDLPDAPDATENSCTEKIKGGLLVVASCAIVRVGASD
jgi:hypothetical protein